MTGRLLCRDELSAADEAAMFELLQSQFVGVSWDRFQADLDTKNWVVLLDNRFPGKLAGFSTFALYDTRFERKDVSVVCSGDTVVDPSTWFQQALSCFWIGAINSLRRRLGKTQLNWLLIVSGYRTYRFLPVYWREFYPRHDAKTPPDSQEMIDFLARERFGFNYLKDKGVVRLPSPQRLRDGFHGIPPERLNNPHIAFFAERNPGHEFGDELVCFAELEHSNLTPAGARMWAKGDQIFACSEVRA